MLRESRARFLFPYPQQRPIQRKLVEILLKGEHAIIEAPTGAGKTAALLASLEALRQDWQKVVIFVRTLGQVHSYVREHARIAAQVRKLRERGVDIEIPKLLPILGKRHLCVKLDTQSQPLNRYALRNICMKTRCNLREPTEDLSPSDVQQMANSVLAGGRRTEAARELLSDFELMDLCPFHLQYRMAIQADIIVTTYPFLFNSRLKTRLLEAACVEWKELIVAVDEAHNLREPPQSSVAKSSLDYLHRFLPDLEVVNHLTRAMETPGIRALNVPLSAIEEATLILTNGSFGREEQIDLLADILEFLLHNNGNPVVVHYDRLVTPPLVPKHELKSLLETQCSFLVSGSLVPLEAYRILFGFPLQSAYRVVNRADSQRISASYLVLNDRRYRLEYQNRTSTRLQDVGSAINSIHQQVANATLAFTTNYDLVSRIGQYAEADFIEKRDSSVEEALEVAGQRKHSLLVAVAGGRLAEGIELVREGKSMISAIIVAGVPFPVPGEEERYKLDAYRKAYGEKHATLLTRELATTSSIQQMMGRAVRSSSDRAVHVFLDSRIRCLRAFSRLPKYGSLSALNRQIRALRV